MNHLKGILEELVNSSKNIEDNTNIRSQISHSGKVFTYGLGRSGLVLQMFAMRLAQLGFNSHAVGEVTSTAINSQDLLILASGSGNTAQVKIVASEAKKAGASVFLITSNEKSEIGKIADEKVLIHSKSKYSNDNHLTNQPMGSLFEQILMLYLDSLVMDIMKKENIYESDMMDNHANLE
ncbi:SIS domain-containing protein [Apilactobacillus apisilvae]|uniref:SIS domain-containing protein n=1 Tax=Apilactobacillus apisilvae TaxID=2923364 RepID=A0ABY4PHY4_9LACO|nr:6-phospho-3-hexuloisomerase [Apilactobacillus apisilvae]UQS85379.1 SIS domain-containing protein [Apilactobacillus apisilvae]